MSLAGLAVVPKTPEELGTWSFEHMAHHRDIIRVLYQQFSLVLTEFILDPFNPNELDLWVYQHQFMHQQMDAVLGIVGFDLSQLDWADPVVLGNWINANQSEHYQAGQILGLG